MKVNSIEYRVFRHAALFINDKSSMVVHHLRLTGYSFRYSAAGLAWHINRE
jgi:hypothetical protein